MRRTVVLTALIAAALLVRVPSAGAQTVDEIVAKNLGGQGRSRKTRSHQLRPDDGDRIRAGDVGAGHHRSEASER